jgi:hypothetical protein
MRMEQGCFHLIIYWGESVVYILPPSPLLLPLVPLDPGYGFLSESQEFSRRMWEEAGAVAIGPGWGILAKTGDKLRARLLADQCTLVIQVPNALSYCTWLMMHRQCSRITSITALNRQR